MGSLETVTVLFTDLVGSTGLATRVGPAAAEELRREHFALLRGAVEASGGREVKNVGDGLMVVFPSASSAVACAVAMQQRLEQRNRNDPEQLMIRVGVSAGEADREDDDYFGPPVVEAARLCNAAQGGQILCGDIVKAMARNAEARSVGALELKGLPQPFPAHEVAWEPLGAARGEISLPRRLREVPPVGYAGRRTEREALAFLLDAVRAGARRVAFISGEPGIGKTRLATHLAVEAHGDGATVLHGGCDEELGVAYGPWTQALRHYVAEAPEDALRAHVERHGGELARLVPELHERVPGAAPPAATDPETQRYLLFGAVAGLLADAAREAPVVLILDDLHWADKPSLSLLRHLVTHGGEIAVLVIGTYRDSDLTRDHPLAALLADLHREEGVSRVPLTGLVEDDVVAIMQAAAGHEMEEPGHRLARAIVDETDGNPFFVGELLRHLVEAGTLVQGDDGRFRLEGEVEDIGLPQSVREVVGRRVQRLSEPTRRMLGVAAVVGREFSVDVLARALESSEDELLDQLDEAVESSLVNESSEVVGRFSFAHALVNHTLYEDLGRTRRVRLHRRIAEALEELCGADPGDRVAELAFHWAQATTPENPRKAIDYARMAGQRALDDLAPAEALRWFEQARDLQRDTVALGAAERCDVLIGLGEAQRQLGDLAHRETLLEASRLAIELRDAERAATAALANSRGWNAVFGEVDGERIAALEQAIALDGFANPGRCAVLMARQAAELQFDPDHERRWALAARAVEIARESGDPSTLAPVLGDYIYTMDSRKGVAALRAAVEEYRTAADESGDPARRASSALSQAIADTLEGRVRAAEERIAEARHMADKLGEPGLRWVATYFHAQVKLAEGDLAAAERIATEAFQVGTELGQPDVALVYGGQITTVRGHQGRLDEVVAVLEQALATSPGISTWLASLAYYYGLLGRRDEAVSILERALGDGFDVGYDQVRTSTLSIYAYAAFVVEYTDAAEPLYRLLEPLDGEVVANGATAHGSVGTYMGCLAALLGRHELADRHFEETAAMEEREGLRVGLAHTHVCWAESLTRRGDHARARSEAERALAIAREGGYGVVETRANSVLAAAVPSA